MERAGQKGKGAGAAALAVDPRIESMDTPVLMLVAEADKLVEIVATGDAAAIGGQLQATGKACGGCHKPFRVPPAEH